MCRESFVPIEGDRNCANSPLIREARSRSRDRAPPEPCRANLARVVLRMVVDARSNRSAGEQSSQRPCRASSQLPFIGPPCAVMTLG